VNDSPALLTLERFAQKRATVHEVMRALATHEHYFVPIGFAPALGRNEYERIVMLSQQGVPPKGELYVFTDEHCLDLVAEQPLGSFVTPVSGLELLCALPEDGSVTKLKVNPGGSLSRFWFMGDDALPLARLWGRAIRLEALLADPSRSKAGLHAALRTFEGFTVLVNEKDAVATARGAGGFQNPAMVFTSPDSFQAVLGQVPALQPVTMDGPRLFELLPRAGVDGIAFNVVGPGPTAFFPLSLGVDVLQLS
jgi:hypothetical protein